MRCLHQQGWCKQHLVDVIERLREFGLGVGLPGLRRLGVHRTWDLQADGGQFFVSPGGQFYVSLNTKV